mgnify:CR=1 FL=1
MLRPIGSNTAKYKAGDPCKFHDFDMGMSFGAIFMGIALGFAYVVLDDGSFNKIPVSWLS